MCVFLKIFINFYKSFQDLLKKSLFFYMNKRNQKTFTHCRETSRTKSFFWQKPKIRENNNLLRIILNIKQEQEARMNSADKPQAKEFQLEKQSSNSQIQADDCSFESNEMYLDFEMLNFRRFTKRRKEKLGKMMNEDEQVQIQNSYLLKKVLQKILKEAQSLKNQLKGRKGLSLDTQFVSENSHVCQFCGKKFLKPCSLGGHISKLHSEQKRKDREMKEMNDWQFETPARKH